MGFTQTEVAEILSYVSRPYLSHLERGGKLPSLVTALKLEILYRVPVAFLFPEHYARLKGAIRESEDRVRDRDSRHEKAA
jgi:transcriptional regulator with XRE-family HTH domain